jgi:hypothetical protein
VLTCPNNRRRVNLFLLTDPMNQQLPAGYFSRLERSATELSTLETLLLQFPAANKLHICIRMNPYGEEADVLSGALCKRSLDFGVSPSALLGQITDLTIEATNTSVLWLRPYRLPTSLACTFRSIFSSARKSQWETHTE